MPSVNLLTFVDVECFLIFQDLGTRYSYIIMVYIDLWNGDFSCNPILLNFSHLGLLKLLLLSSRLVQASSGSKFAPQVDRGFSWGFPSSPQKKWWQTETMLI